jgi:hypothetical protein
MLSTITQTHDFVLLGRSHTLLLAAHVRSLQRRLGLTTRKPCLLEILPKRNIIGNYEPRALDCIAYAKIDWAPHEKETVQIEAILNHFYRPSVPAMMQSGDFFFTTL